MDTIILEFIFLAVIGLVVKNYFDRKVKPSAAAPAPLGNLIARIEHFVGDDITGDGLPAGDHSVTWQQPAGTEIVRIDWAIYSDYFTMVQSGNLGYLVTAGVNTILSYSTIINGSTSSLTTHFPYSGSGLTSKTATTTRTVTFTFRNTQTFSTGYNTEHSIEYRYV
jgi:hypothetical protein